jgi:hypothetical protein
MTSRLPSEWTTKKPIERYETQFIYVGLGRYNTVKKTISYVLRTNDKTVYEEVPFDGQLARAYTVEWATISVYSLSPRVWKEETGVTDTTVFIETR